MEGLDEQEEGVNKGTDTADYDNESVKIVSATTEDNYVDADSKLTSDAKQLSSAMERSGSDSDMTYHSTRTLQRPIGEIGSERLMMRSCPFFYIPDSTHKKKVAKVQAKVGSLSNINYTAGGGNKKVFSGKVDVSAVTSRVITRGHTFPKMQAVNDIRKTNDNKFREPAVQVSSKIGSLKNLGHMPGGGDKKIPTFSKPDYKHKISAKVDTADPIPSVHHPRHSIDELSCGEVIHYHTRYQRSRPHSAPVRHMSNGRNVRPSGSNMSISLQHPLSKSSQDNKNNN